jgi:hypothetical protein
MDNYIIHEFRTSDGVYKVDYDSLANLPEIGKNLSEGEGISIMKDQSTTTISVSQELSDTIGRLVDKTFPVSATIVSSEGFGNHEEGDVVNVTMSWIVTRDDSGISGSTITPMIQVGNGDWILEESFTDTGTYSYYDIITGTSIKLQVHPPVGTQDITLGPLSVKFLRYRYYGVLNSKPTTITESLIKSLGTHELSSSTTLGSTSLASGKYFLFAVPGTPTLVVRHSGTDSIVDAEIGTIGLTRKNGTQGSILYSWILVPASSITWSFVIKNN